MKGAQNLLGGTPESPHYPGDEGGAEVAEVRAVSCLLEGVSTDSLSSIEEENHSYFLRSDI